MLNAIPKTYGRHSAVVSAGNNLLTSSGVKALLNSCLYPSSARSRSSAPASTIASLLVMVVDGGCGVGGGCSKCNVLSVNPYIPALESRKKFQITSTIAPHR